MTERRERLEVRLLRQVWLAAALLGLVLVQTDLLPRPLGALVNLLLIVVVCKTALDGLSAGALWAFYGGLWLDLLGSGMIGGHVLLLMLAAAFAGGITQTMDYDNLLLPLALVAAGTLCFHLGNVLFSGGGDSIDFAIVVLLPALMVNLILALPLYMLLRWWKRRSNPRLEW